MPKVRTSVTHPLQIAEVPLPTGGTLGLTLCPGKKQLHSHTGIWDRDLKRDLRAIKAWGAAELVTLMPADELNALQVTPEQIQSSCASLGLEWCHLAIAESSTPDAAFEYRWLSVGTHLRKLLRQDKRVVIHCKGGLGRTGTIAARLMVESGYAPAAAIQAVRLARPGSIQNADQENHVFGSKCLAWPSSKAVMDLLQTVGILHRRGYGRLRIHPYHGASGFYRIELISAADVSRFDGLKPVFSKRIAGYSEADGRKYFGWSDFEGDAPEEIADKLLTRLPTISNKCRGHDFAYFSWYQKVLDLAADQCFPTAYYDYCEKPLPGQMHTFGEDGFHQCLASPPGGEAIVH